MCVRFGAIASLWIQRGAMEGRGVRTLELKEK